MLKSTARPLGWWSGCALFGLMLLVLGCGPFDDHQSSTATASGARTQSPIPPSTPNPFQFGQGDCTAPASGTATEALGTDKVVVNIPTGWTRVPPGRTETILLSLQAPAAYSNAPTTIWLQSFSGPQLLSAHDEAMRDAQQNSQVDPQSVADCVVGGSDAAFYKLAKDNRVAYQIYVTHFSPNAGVTLLYGLRLEGQLGLDPKAIADAKMVLGSWQWGG